MMPDAHRPLVLSHTHANVSPHTPENTAMISKVTQSMSINHFHSELFNPVHLLIFRTWRRCTDRRHWIQYTVPTQQNARDHEQWAEYHKNCHRPCNWSRKHTWFQLNQYHSHSCDRSGWGCITDLQHWNYNESSLKRIKLKGSKLILKGLLKG